MEGTYVRADGSLDDSAFWAEVLGADASMHWDPGTFTHFPAARSPHDLWPQLLVEAEHIKHSAEGASTPLLQTYLKTYPAYCRLLDGPGAITQDQLLIAASCAYAWMPRVLRLDMTRADAARAAVSAAKRGSLINRATVAAVTSFLAGSVVGASKLLHFAAPSTYAIWDRRVAARLRARRVRATGREAELLYFEYLNFCQQMLSYSQAEELTAILSPLLGPDVTSLRALEFVLYSVGGSVPVTPDDVPLSGRAAV